MSNIPSAEEIIADLMRQNDGVHPNSPIPLEQQLERKRAEYRELIELVPFKQKITLAIETIQREMTSLLPPDEFESVLSEIAEAAELLQTNPETKGSNLGLSRSSLDKLFAFARHVQKAGKQTESIALFTLLTTLDASWYRHWFYLGVSLQEHGQFQEAITAYEMAMKIAEEDPFAHLYSAECAVEVKDMHQASLHFIRGKEIARNLPNNPDLDRLLTELESKIK